MTTSQTCPWNHFINVRMTRSRTHFYLNVMIIMVPAEGESLGADSRRYSIGFSEDKTAGTKYVTMIINIQIKCWKVQFLCLAF